MKLITESNIVDGKQLSPEDRINVRNLYIDSGDLSCQAREARRLDLRCCVENLLPLHDMTVLRAGSELMVAAERLKNRSHQTVFIGNRGFTPEFDDDRREMIEGFEGARRDLMSCAKILGAGPDDLVADLI
jgi:hypothetical protein